MEKPEVTAAAAEREEDGAKHEEDGVEQGEHEAEAAVQKGKGKDKGKDNGKGKKRAAQREDSRMRTRTGTRARRMGRARGRKPGPPTRRRQRARGRARTVARSSLTYVVRAGVAMSNCMGEWVRPPSRLTRPITPSLTLQLGGRRIVTVDSWKGRCRVDIREHYLKDKDDEASLAPTKKGISLTPEQWAQLKNISGRIDTALETLEE